MKKKTNKYKQNTNQNLIIYTKRVLINVLNYRIFIQNRHLICRRNINWTNKRARQDLFGGFVYHSLENKTFRSTLRTSTYQCINTGYIVGIYFFLFKNKTKNTKPN